MLILDDPLHTRRLNYGETMKMVEFRRSLFLRSSLLRAELAISDALNKTSVLDSYCVARRWAVYTSEERMRS